LLILPSLVKNIFPPPVGPPVTTPAVLPPNTGPTTTVENTTPPLSPSLANTLVCTCPKRPKEGTLKFGFITVPVVRPEAATTLAKASPCLKSVTRPVFKVPLVIAILIRKGNTSICSYKCSINITSITPSTYSA